MISKTILKDLGRSWPGILISLVSLVVVFAIADFGELKDGLRLADYRYLPFAIGLFVLSIIARTFAWRTLLREQASVRRVFYTINEGYLLNNILPFRLGEVGRGFLMSRTTDIAFLEVMSTILIERAFDISIVVSLFLGTLPFVIGADWARPTAIAVGSVVVAALFVLHLLARNREWILRTFERLQTQYVTLRKVQIDQLDTFIQGLAALTNLKRFLCALSWMLVAWLLIVVEYYLILLAFVPGAKFIWSAFGISVVGLGVAVPAAPGSIGVVQGTLVAVFSFFSFPPAIALAYSLTVHAIYLVLTSGLGIYGLWVDGDSLVTIYGQLREQTTRLRVRNRKV